MLVLVRALIAANDRALDTAVAVAAATAVWRPPGQRVSALATVFAASFIILRCILEDSMTEAERRLREWS